MYVFYKYAKYLCSMIYINWDMTRGKLGRNAPRISRRPSVHCGGSLEVGRAAAPEKTMSFRIQGKSVRTSIQLSVHPSIRPKPYKSWLGRTNEWTGRWTDVRSDLPSIKQEIVPFGAAAQKVALVYIEKALYVKTIFKKCLLIVWVLIHS